MVYVLFVIGFFFLIKGADYLVSGAGAIAKKFGIPPIVIGLTIVSFGTSAPELIVNIMSSLNGNADIAIGNILGSNIANILLILGVAAAIYPLKVQKNTAWKEIPFSLLAVLLLFVMANDTLIDGFDFNVLSKSDGLALLGFFAIFMYYVFTIALNGRHTQENKDEDDEIKDMNIPLAAFYIVLGCLGLFLGGQWIVDGAVVIATRFGLSEGLIALTIIAIGTSLPELATSAQAALKKHSDIAVGNVVGSNIFNVFWILGISSVINPIEFNPLINFDLAVTTFATVMMFLFLYIAKRHHIDRWQGVTFIVMYGFYIFYLVLRG